MYAIRNKRNKKYVFGTDYRYNPPHQRLSNDKLLTYDDYEFAQVDFMVRRCGKDYEIIPIKIIELT